MRQQQTSLNLRVGLRAIAALILIGAAWVVARDMSSGKEINFQPWQIAAAAALMAANCWLGPLRLHLTGRAVGAAIPTKTAGLAISSGFFAGALGLSVFGQAGGTVGVLALAKVHPYKAAIIFGAERGLALCVLGTAASLSALALYGRDIPPLTIAAAASILGVGTVALAPSLLKLADSYGLNSRWLLASLLVTALMQGCCLAAWIVMLNGAPGIVPGAVLVMLASAVPFGLAGFGPREVGAVTILSPLGVAAIDAFSAAVTIGLTSLAAVTMLGLWSVAGHETK